MSIIEVWLENDHWCQNLYSHQKDHVVFVVSFLKRKHGFKLLDVKTNFGDHANTVGKILLHRTNRNAYYVN
jgi:hypothetical protein